MTTHSDISRIEPYWFGRPEAEIRAAVEARAEAWDAVPGFSRYEWSDKGRLRRKADRYAMKLNKVNNYGYVIVNVVRDSDGKQVTVAVAPMILLAHHPEFRGLAAFPDGLETRHNPAVGDKRFNPYPEGIWPGTKAENNGADKGPAIPQHPCLNHPMCGNKVRNPGKRCLDCVTAMGREVAQLLTAGMQLQAAAEQFGIGADWAYSVAVRFGGYEGTKADAARQHPNVARRVRLRALSLRLARERAGRR